MSKTPVTPSGLLAETASIHVAPRDSIVEVTRRSGARHLVTCMVEGQPPTPDGIAPGRHLRLPIHDIEAPLEGYRAPGAEHTGDLLDFVRGWDCQAPLLIHCYAGVSRSTAAAFIALCALNPGYDEALIAARLRRLSPKAQPNRLFVSHADSILGRGGRMVRAIESIGPGDVSGLNTPFAIPALLK